MPCHDNIGSGFAYPDPKTERDLCEARWVLYRITKGKKHQDSKMQGLIDKHVLAQVRHRRKDRQYVLNELNRKIEGTVDRAKTIVRAGGEAGKKLLTERKVLKAMSAKLKALSDTDLLEEYWQSEKCVADILKDKE